METKNLQTFIQVAELNSFTKAARILNYSQSTVSFQISQLEKELDCLLFERINHTLKLTDRGQEFLHRAQMICRLADEFGQKSGSPEMIHGSVHVVTSDSILEAMMYNDFIAFNRLYPGISVKFSTASTNRMFEMLDQNEADIVLTLDQHMYRKDYVIVREKRSDTHFVVGANNPLSKMDRVTVSDLLTHPLYLTEKGMGYRGVLDDLMQKRSIELQPVLEISRTDIITDLLGQGDGVSFLPDFVTEAKVRTGRLKRLIVPEIELEIWKQMIHHKNKWISEPLQAFISYASEHEFGSY